MDIYAGMFGLGIILVSVWVAYRWGIKPDREEKKRRAELALWELRQQARKSRQRTASERSPSAFS
jgi:hypothetical protein